MIAAVCAAVALLFLRPTPARVEVGSKAPDFQARNVATREMVSLHGAYANTVTLVNIWGTWCGPCVKEMPAMDSLFRALQSRGFRIAAVSVDEPSLDGVRDFVKKHNIGFDVLNDSSGRIKDLYQAEKVPESFLIDKNGRLVRIIQNSAPWNSAQNYQIIEQLLAEKGR